MRYTAEIPKPNVRLRRAYAFQRLYCEECMIGFQFELVPCRNGGPVCPMCGNHIWHGWITGLRSVKKIRETK